MFVFGFHVRYIYLNKSGQITIIPTPEWLGILVEFPSGDQPAGQSQQCAQDECLMSMVYGNLVQGGPRGLINGVD